MAKALPSALEAEVSLLGTMLVYPSSTRSAMEEGLMDVDFYSESHQKIFRAMQALYQKGTPVDFTSVSTRLQDENQLDQIGGVSYLSQLIDAAVTSANTKTYVEMIIDKALMRKMILASEQVAQDGYDGQVDINEYFDLSEKRILNISRNRRTSEFQDSHALMNSVLEQIRINAENKSDITGLKTGFKDLDYTTHGLQRGDFIVVAARPSMGKTAVSLNLAMNVAAYSKQPVAIFSLEMGADQLAMRLLSARSRLSGDKLKTGRLSNDEWNQLHEAASELQNMGIYIDDTPGIKVSEIFSKCRRLQADHGLNLILIDYIQLISGTSMRKGESRQQEVSDISRSLKALARELKVPVIALSQLSRTVEQRENKRPMLSDLRESGAIEQDADIVMMLFRESYYDEAAKQKADETGQEELEINIAKHRNGATRKIKLAFEGSTNALFNLVNIQG